MEAPSNGLLTSHDLSALHDQTTAILRDKMSTHRLRGELREPVTCGYKTLLVGEITFFKFYKMKVALSREDEGLPIDSSLIAFG